MAISVDAVGVAGLSLALATLKYLKDKQIIVDDDVREILQQAQHPPLATTGGQTLNAEAANLISELSRNLLPQRKQ